MSIGCPDGDGRLAPAAVDAILEAAERAAAVVARPGSRPRRRRRASWSRSSPRRIEAPLLVDADGLNALAGRSSSLAERSAPTVITPHAGELGRLLEIDSDESTRTGSRSATEAAARSGAVVVLKGDDTIVAAPDSAPRSTGSRARRSPPPAPATCSAG